MEKIKTQTVYISVDDNSDKRFGWVVNSEGKGVLPVEKKEDQVVMSKEEIGKIINTAFDAHRELKVDNESVDDFIKYKQWYISNLLNNEQ